MNLHSKQGQSPVGKTALCPTLTQTTNEFHFLLSILNANTHLFYWVFDLCQLMSNRWRPDLRLFINARHYNMTYLSHKLLIKLLVVILSPNFRGVAHFAVFK